jgi:hypothetical protein
VEDHLIDAILATGECSLALAMWGTTPGLDHPGLEQEYNNLQTDKISQLIEEAAAAAPTYSKPDTIKYVSGGSKDSQGEFWAMKEVMGMCYTRRIKILAVPLPFLLGIVAGGGKILVPAELVNDAVLIRVFQDDVNQEICMVLTHESFDEVLSGQHIPRFRATVIYYPPEEADVTQIKPQLEDGLEREI